LRVPRSVIIRIVLERTGTDLKQPSTAEEIVAAIEYLELLRMGKEPLPPDAAVEPGT
jgi:hypothetical protein